MKVAIIIALCLGAMVVGVIAYDMSVDNRVVKLHNLYDKHLAKVETFHDKMWKTIKSQAKVTEKQRDAFKDIYVGIMEGRYGGDDGGMLMKWIKEDNPAFDQTTYKKLMTTIEAQRDGFFREQDTIQGVVKEHNDILVTKPQKWFVNDGVEPLHFNPISSTRSKKVMETGIDDDLALD
jgi:hypothetical protein